MNSRLASTCWPERAATALAIEIDCPSATMVSAAAMPSRSGTVRQLMSGTWKGGRADGIGPITFTCCAPSQWLSASATPKPPTRPISMNGSRREMRRTISVTASVTAPTMTALQLIVAAFSNRKRTTPNALVPVGTASPNRSLSA
ncbi:hypothetical protein D3C87_1083830 [compost metagenome]